MTHNPPCEAEYLYAADRLSGVYLSLSRWWPQQRASPPPPPACSASVADPPPNRGSSVRICSGREGCYRQISEEMRAKLQETGVEATTMELGMEEPDEVEGAQGERGRGWTKQGGR
jgi:hypothetical protein